MTPTIKFNRLRFVNFGPFVDECVLQLDRGPGLWHIAGNNLVEPQLGANGAGKTTLLNALFWVITGRTMRSRRPGARVEARKGKGTTEVELNCTRGREPFNIIRTRKPNTLTLNGNPTTDADLLNEFGIKPEVLQYTCMFGQSNPMFLSIGKEEQAALFNDLLDLDIWLKVADKAKTTGGIAEKSATAFKEVITEATGSLKSFREARKTARAQAEAFDRETAEKTKELSKQYKIKEKELRQIEEALAKLGPPTDYTSLEDLRSTADNKLRVFQTRKASELSNRANASDNLKTVRQQLEKAKAATCDACGQKLPAVTQKQTIHRLSQRIHMFTETIRTYDEALKQLETDIQSWDKKRRRAITLITDARTADAGARTTLAHNKATLSMNLQTIKRDITALSAATNPHDSTDRLLLSRIKQFKITLADATSGFETAERLSTLASLWQISAKEIRLSIIDEALEETAAMATKHAERLGLRGWRVDLATERQTMAGTTALGFTANLYPLGEEAPIAWETYSGGEENRLQLAMSYGLSDVLLTRAGLNLNIEWCDESTRGLSAEGISDLIECLAERARETGKTIYMIDHHALDRGNFSGTLMVEKSKTGSHIREA